jgi:hypothetical protein
MGSKEIAERINHIDENYPDATVLPSGIRVYNLPRAEQFSEYRRSTIDIASNVDSQKTLGVGFGAGVGAAADKRLGWLRPRQGSQEALAKHDEKQRNDELSQSFSTGDAIDWKNPEELRRHQKNVRAKLAAMQGSTMSMNEHFLLCDLDFDRDAMLFGHTREEFESNAKKLQEVIVAYQRWERTDNFFRLGIWALRGAFLYLIIDIAHALTNIKMLEGFVDDFAAAVGEDIERLDAARHEACQKAVEAIRLNPPNFQDVLRKIEEECAERQRGGREVTASPMDTTSEQLFIEQRKDMERQHQMERFIDSEGPEHRPTTAPGSTLGSVTRRVLGWALSGATAQKATTSKELGRVDLSTLSFSAAPTSIDTVRAVRRILLPQSQDYTRIVHAEIVEYKREKEMRPKY